MQQNQNTGLLPSLTATVYAGPGATSVLHAFRPFAFLCDCYIHGGAGKVSHEFIVEASPKATGGKQGNASCLVMQMLASSRWL